ncbi:hypothetical protein EXU57_00420 [Segetibacter sp. 3557_3]|uniref:hypothetical protein n=1 Tax=Segetibacter sp. 3557_3 TaxID=2547429 RepID=UPI0010588B06|nr:hypothetical protein [Segetibacter sp. 3557_3]TDH28576.1 hypothetical protein EXU57_00420 [Segetibacter sp. 3557_3]
MKTILYLTDLYYEAKGRNYYEEDLYITSKLMAHFSVMICHPIQAISFLDRADIVVFRNTGPVIYYKENFNAFLDAVERTGVLTFNSFDGKADIRGKQYLPDLWNAGYPVIPTVDTINDIDKLGKPERYVVKLLDGADSIGMEILTKSELSTVLPGGKLIQPLLDFEYEVSFYYMNESFQYALYAPDVARRWELRLYDASADDLEFANKFIRWNTLKRGISRVDACRMPDGRLLLVELEDLNPYLSVGLLSEEIRNRFIDDLVIALETAG